MVGFVLNFGIFYKYVRTQKLESISSVAGSKQKLRKPTGLKQFQS